jgi:ABC-2 type transport system ATP-binding protein
MPPLQVQSLTKWYGSTKGIEDVTFAIQRGEIFGYLGPNGSGKTTTIRCIMGLLKPSRGEIRVLGERVVAGWATQHARIGYLPGEFRLWPRMGARKALSFLAALGDTSRAKSRRDELAKRLDVNLDRPVGDLSKGNRQKVAVIYAFQHQPELIILDEPTAGLDPLVRQTVLDSILEAADGGATVLLSSHDLSEVSAICGCAGILREGRLVAVAPVSKILQQGEHRLKVWFANRALVPQMPADRLPGVRVIQQQPGMMQLAYQGASDAVLKWIAQFPVDRIATPQTSLEEAFIQYYRCQPGPAEAQSGDNTLPESRL